MSRVVLNLHGDADGQQHLVTQRCCWPALDLPQLLLTAAVAGWIIRCLPCRMKWVRMDVGEQAIDWLYTTQLQVDEEWSVRTPTGFTWWADKNAQTIEIVGEETGPDGGIGYLLSVRTEMLRDLELTEAALVELNDGPMRCAAMAGPVYDADTRTLSLCSLVLVYDDIASWMQVLLSTAAVLQIAEARSLGPALAESLHALEATSSHPRNGVRSSADEMAFAAGVFVAAGKDPCKWKETEFQDAVDGYMKQPPSIGASSGGLGFTVEFPFGDASSLCQVMGKQPHPLYGNGLLLLHRFPFDAGSQADGIRLALSLNASDLTRQVTGYGFGSYVYTDKMICFTAFFPNELHKQGLLTNLYFSCTSRAQAMSMRLMNRQWNADSFSLESSAMGRIMLGDKEIRDPDPRQADLPLMEDNAYEASSGAKTRTIHVDRNPDGELTFADTNGEPILAYDAENSTVLKDAEGRPIMTGWVLHVEHYKPFVMGVQDFDGVDDALAKAESYLEMPLPNASRLPGRRVGLQNEQREDGSWLNIDASLERDGTVQITGQDFGPVTKNISPDGEYEWFYTIAAKDVPALVVALGGPPGTDVIDLLEQRWSGDAAYNLETAIRSSGVKYDFAHYP
ncbi:MAG TPA: hypothetical protein VGL17_13910 [Gemmatimonadaceae bacterium]